MDSGELEHVVHIHEVGGVTAHHLAADPPELEHGALMGGGPPFQMGHVLDVDPVFDHDRQRRLTQQFAHRGHRHRADPADLTGLAGLDLTAA